MDTYLFYLNSPSGIRILDELMVLIVELRVWAYYCWDGQACLLHFFNIWTDFLFIFQFGKCQYGHEFQVYKTYNNALSF